MADRWYFVQEGQRHGPVSQEQLKRLASSGHLKHTDFVWRKGMADWTLAAEVSGFFDEPPPLPSTTPPVYCEIVLAREVVMTPDGPVPVDEYSPTWNAIKARMRANGLGYMLDTQEKRNRCAKQVGMMVGLGAGTFGYRLLQRLGILP